MEMAVTDAYFVREGRAMSCRIEAVLDMGHKESIYESIVEHCCKDFSLNELKEIRHRLYCKLHDIGGDDTPLIFTEMYNELLSTIDKREKHKE